MTTRFTPVVLPLTHAARAIVALTAAFALIGPAYAADDAASAAVEASAPLAAGTHIAIKPGASLNDLAIEVTGSHDRNTVSRAAKALFDANPSAFFSHDPSRLKLGATVIVPALDATGAPVASEASAASAPAGSASSAAAASTPAAASAAATAPAASAATAAAASNAPAAATTASTAVAASSAPGAAAASASAAATAQASNGHSVSGAIQASPAAAANAGASQPTVSSLQQLLALKNRVLQELDHSNAHPASSGAAAPASAAPGAAASGAAPNGAASGAAAATPSSNAAEHIGPPAIIGAALAALVIGWLLRRRKHKVHADAVALDPPAEGEGWPKPGSLAYDARKAAAAEEAVDVEAHAPGEVEEGAEAAASPETGGYEAEAAHAADLAGADVAASELMGASSAAHEETEAAAAEASPHAEPEPVAGHHEAEVEPEQPLDTTAAEAHDAAEHAATEAPSEPEQHPVTELAPEAALERRTVELDPPMPPLVSMDEKVVEHTPTLPASPARAPAPMLHDMLAGMLAAEASRTTSKLKAQVPPRSYSPVQPAGAAPAVTPTGATAQSPAAPAAPAAETQPAASTPSAAELPPQEPFDTQAAASAEYEPQEARAAEPPVEESQAGPTSSVEPEVFEPQPPHAAEPSVHEPHMAAETGHDEQPQPYAPEGAGWAATEATPPAQHVTEPEPTHAPAEPSPEPAPPVVTEEIGAHHAPDTLEADEDQHEPSEAFTPPLGRTPKFPQEAIDALGSLDLTLPPRNETAEPAAAVPAPEAEPQPDPWRPREAAADGATSTEVPAEPQPSSEGAPSDHETHAHEPSPFIASEPLAAPESALFDGDGHSHGHAPTVEEQTSHEAEPPHAAEEIEAGIVGAASVAGLGAATFGALNLDFNLDLPPTSEEPPPFTPNQLARIARNKLDLASAYIELGDLGGARTLINEVIESNDAATRDEARALLSTLAPLS